MEFIFIAIILLFVLEYNRKIDTRKFIADTEPYFRFLMEDDYKFLLNLKYGNISDEDVNVLFGKRVRNGALAIIFVIFYTVMSSFNFITFILAFIIGFVVFKVPYNNVKSYYRRNLAQINQMLPFYLKGLEILIQHYTVPVALSRSIDTAPEIFKPGLKRMIDKIEAGDSSIEPYMDFAKEYPVRDSMRMMRLLYRLGIGSQENKQEQLIMFSRNISSLQNKSREQRYAARLDKMEGKTKAMLFTTGGGVIALLFLAMLQMMGL
jgi:hypothetical protein